MTEKSEILRNAWVIAKEAQKVYGYSVRDYLAESMKIAWEQAKNGEEEMNIKLLKTDELEKLMTEIRSELDERKSEKPEIVTIKLHSGGTSGNRKSWFKKVDSVDPSQKGGYAYDGDFLESCVELELKVGTIIIECSPRGSVKNGWKEGSIHKIKSDGTLETLVEGMDWKSDAVSFRKEVEKYV
jgi:hypothetical protein